MPQLTPYLFFNGNCAEAMRFYSQTLSGKLELVPASPGADKLPGSAELTMHARVELPGGGELMASDWMDNTPYKPVQGCAVALMYETAEEAHHIYDALAQGGKASMPFEKTFFAEGFGMLTDRFGTPWMVGGRMTG